MKRKWFIALSVVASLALAGACKKKDDKNKKKKPTPNKKVPNKDPNKGTKPTDPKSKTPPTKTKSVADSVTACMAAFEKKDWKTARECLTDDATQTIVGASDKKPGEDMTFSGADKIIEGAKNWGKAFDGKNHSEILLVNGNTAVVLSSWTGKNIGPLPEMKLKEATNKNVAGFGIMIMEIENGKAKSMREYWDGGLLMMQLAGKAPPKSLEFKGWEMNESVTAKDDKKEKDNLALLEGLGKAVAKGDMKAAMATFHKDVVVYMNGMPESKGVKAKAEFMKMLKRAFPDFTLSVKTKWAAGDYVFAEVEWTGTNKGPMGKLIPKATNKAVKMTNAEIFKVENGKVTKQWIVMNTGSLMAQLGMMKMEGDKAPKKGAPMKKQPPMKKKPMKKPPAMKKG